jgi:hypothetical protein
MSTHPNQLSKYQDIIETYLVGLCTKLGITVRIYFAWEKGQVSFRRTIPHTSKDKALAIDYFFDEKTLNWSEPSAEWLRVNIHSLHECLTRTIMRFTDQFYQDRFAGKPFVDDTLMDFSNTDGSITQKRVDEIDWIALFQ